MRFVNGPSEPMTRDEIRGWIDGEGSIGSKPPPRCHFNIEISQKSKEPLEQLSNGLVNLGIRAHISYVRSHDSHRIRIHGYENVARLLTLVGPFRTQQKFGQVGRLLENLSACHPRKSRQLASAVAIIDPFTDKLNCVRDDLLDRKELRAWIDTEGCLHSQAPPKPYARVEVAQKDRAPLDVFSNSLHSFSVPCQVSYLRSRDSYRAVVWGFWEVAKIIKEFGPFRTPQKQDQVRKFMNDLIAPRERRSKAVEAAKSMLGLTSTREISPA